MNNTRVIDNKPAQTYSLTWINDNLNNFINGALVSEWILVDEYLENFVSPIWNGTEFIEGATPEEIAEQTLSKIALHEKYPEVQGMNWQLLQLDNLPGIQRMEPTSDKGLKGIKKYEKEGVLIWSIETKFWFELD